MINYQNDMFFNNILDNSGTGTNFGVDLTFERFMNNGYYYMVSASVYESVIYDYSNPYQEQWSNNVYLDLSLNYRVNKSRLAQIIILQVKNMTMHKDLIGFAYNYKDHLVDPIELAIILPYLSYKIEF